MKKILLLIFLGTLFISSCSTGKLDDETKNQISQKLDQSYDWQKYCGLSIDDFRNVNKNKELAIKYIEKGCRFSELDEKMRFDRDIATYAADRLIDLKFTSEVLRGDKDFVKRAIFPVNGYGVACVNLAYASEEIKNDKQLILEIVSKKGKCLSLVTKKFKEDKDIVLAAVKQNGGALIYAEGSLTSDPELIKLKGDWIANCKRESAIGNFPPECQ